MHKKSIAEGGEKGISPASWLFRLLTKKCNRERDSVTFGDPETSRSTTSCRRKVSLRPATGGSHPIGFEYSSIRQIKWRPQGPLFNLAERKGFEPLMGFPIPLFESGQFNHSCISPHFDLHFTIFYPRKKNRCYIFYTRTLK